MRMTPSLLDYIQTVFIQVKQITKVSIDRQMRCTANGMPQRNSYVVCMPGFPSVFDWSLLSLWRKQGINMIRLIGRGKSTQHAAKWYLLKGIPGLFPCADMLWQRGLVPVFVFPTGSKMSTAKSCRFHGQGHSQRGFLIRPAQLKQPSCYSMTVL